MDDPTNTLAPNESPLITHKTPIIIGSGSLWMDTKDELDDDSTVTGDKYGLTHERRVKGAEYGQIANVSILQEGENVKFWTHFLLPDGCELQIWLQKQISGTTYEPLKVNPQVYLHGIAGTPSTPGEVVIRSDELLDSGQSLKVNRPHRYSHSGYGLGVHFRIGQWKIHNPTSTSSHVDNGDDSYIISLNFKHP